VGFSMYLPLRMKGFGGESIRRRHWTLTSFRNLARGYATRGESGIALQTRQKLSKNSIIPALTRRRQNTKSLKMRFLPLGRSRPRRS
jgi:hypothetical protein